jgi:hypothetical protein
MKEEKSRSLTQGEAKVEAPAAAVAAGGQAGQPDAVVGSLA